MNEPLQDRPVAQRVLGAFIAIVLFVGIAAAIARQGGTTISGAGRLDTDGRARVTHLDGTSFVSTGPTTLRDGDVVEALEGRYTIALPDGATLEGRQASNRADATKIKAGSLVELLGGELLVTSTRTARVVASSNKVTVQPPSSGPSAVRVGRSLAVNVGTYRGSALIDSAGQQRTVPALRAMEVAVLGRPPAEPRPLSVDHPDAWDLRFLGEAIDLGGTLQSLSNAYSSTLRPDEGRNASFYARLLPALNEVQGYGDPLLRSSSSRPQGEILVGAAIVALGRVGDGPARWSSVFSFRDDGAAWGLVALDQLVSSGPLLDAVKGAVNHTPFEFAGAGTPTAPPPSGATTPPTTSPGSTPTTAPGPTTTAPPNNGTTLPPTTQPTIPPLTLPPLTPPTQPPTGGDGGGGGGNGGGTLVGGLVDTVGQLLGGLLGR